MRERFAGAQSVSVMSHMELWQQIAASGTGAMVTALLMTPLDVVKIRLQAQSKGFVKGDCVVYCNGLMDLTCTCLNGESARSSKLWRRIPNTQFTGTWDALLKITKYEGVTSLWSGLPPTLIMSIPSTVVYYTSYDILKYRLGYREDNPATAHFPLIAASIARAATVTLVSPVELIRTKLQSRPMSYAELCDAVSSAVRNGGLRSLWHGWGPSMLRDVPFSGIYFYLYESMKAFVLRRQESKTTIGALESFVCGAVAGSIAGVVTLPFDVIKTHRQIQIGQELFSSPAARASKSVATVALLKELYEKRGLRSWFTGIGPRLLKVAPACAVMISTYEAWKSFFTLRNAEEELMVLE